jgi:mono/diheme cytochrome c family protein
MSVEAKQPSPAVAPPDEARKLATVPIWLVIALFLLLWWGMVSFDLRGGWFSEQVYAPYHSTEELTAMQPPSGDSDFLLKGQKLFHDNCSVCHMDTGVGNPANGCPPLVGSEWVAAPGPDRVIRIVSKGLTGPIEVSGKVWSTGTMLAIGDALPGDEKQKAESIAAILSYVRKTFGNNPSPLVKPERVATVRATLGNHPNNFTPDEIKTVPDKE